MTYIIDNQMHKRKINELLSIDPAILRMIPTSRFRIYVSFRSIVCENATVIQKK